MNNYPPLSPYGYGADRCNAAWQRLDWSAVTQACASDAQEAAANRQDFASLSIAAQSWAKAAIGYDKIGKTELANEARTKATADVRAALAGFKTETPPDDQAAQSASTLLASIEAPNFYSASGCSP